jgi:hypothetical protein
MNCALSGSSDFAKCSRMLFEITDDLIPRNHDGDGTTIVCPEHIVNKTVGRCGSKDWRPRKKPLRPLQGFFAFYRATSHSAGYLAATPIGSKLGRQPRQAPAAPRGAVRRHSRVRGAV